MRHFVANLLHQLSILQTWLPFQLIGLRRRFVHELTRVEGLIFDWFLDGLLQHYGLGRLPLCVLAIQFVIGEWQVLLRAHHDQLLVLKELLIGEWVIVVRHVQLGLTVRRASVRRAQRRYIDLRWIRDRLVTEANLRRMNHYLRVARRLILFPRLGRCLLQTALQLLADRLQLRRVHRLDDLIIKVVHHVDDLLILVAPLHRPLLLRIGNI